MIKLGFYRHFKGNVYCVIGTATHTETGEPMVVYHPKGNPERLWVRPLSMWNETVNGVPRFKPIE